ncbi:MAG: inositol monophosphatase family protein [Acidithiobacillus sp.]|nr:inositol monophosphatase family protein [Acidithiobacillus sp.]
MMSDFAVDVQWVGALLRESAERFLLPAYHRVTATPKPDGSIVTSADLESQDFLQEALARRYPQIPLLGEEMTAAEQGQLMQSVELLWCLDPLDGTSNFAAGVPIFGISLALLDAHGARQGWVYDPMRRDLFWAARRAGAFCNGDRLAYRQAPALQQSVGVVDYKRLHPEMAIRLVTRQPFHSQRNFGSCVLEWSWLAAGRYHFYLHGAQQLWDWAAGGLFLQEAGGRLSTLTGEALHANALVKCSVLATLDPHLHEQWLTWIDREFPKSQC